MSLNEFGEKSRATVSLIIKILLVQTIIIGQNLNHVYVTYSIDKLLTFDWLALVDVL